MESLSALAFYLSCSSVSFVGCFLEVMFKAVLLVSSTRFSYPTDPLLALRQQTKLMDVIKGLTMTFMDRTKA